MLKRMIGLLFVIIMLIIGAGCLDPTEIDGYGYVISLGIDKGKEEGSFYYTFMLQRESGESSSSGDGGAIIIAEEGKDLYEAINSLEGRIPYLLDFSRMNFVLFGEETAVSGGIEELMKIDPESLQVRMSAVVMICEPDASRFIGGMSADYEANITKLQSAILQDKEFTGMVSVITLSRMSEACSEGRFDFCPALGKYDESIMTDTEQQKAEEEGKDPLEKKELGSSIGGMKSAAVGSALFDGWIMKDRLDRRETMLLNIAIGEFKDGTIGFETEEGSFSIRLSMKKQSMKVASFDENGAVFTDDIVLSAEPLLSGSARMDAEETKRLCSLSCELLDRELDQLYEKCISAESDALRLGTVLSKEFRSVKQWEAYEWKSKYPNCSVRFHVKLEAPYDTAGGVK